MIAGLLYYRKFSESLTGKGYTANDYDPCVWNKTIKGKQCTICFHVDDCKISHVNDKVIDDTINWLRREYESIFTDGSGEMKVARGKTKYLGMALDFANNGVVTVTMIDYIDHVIKTWNDACAKLDNGFELVSKRQKIITAAPDDLFKVDQDAVKLGSAKAKYFHRIVAMMLYVTKRARPDTALAIAYLTTRVKEPDEDDWGKLGHLIVYLKSTRELPQFRGLPNSLVPSSWLRESKSHTKVTEESVEKLIYNSYGETTISEGRPSGTVIRLSYPLQGYRSEDLSSDYPSRGSIFHLGVSIKHIDITSTLDTFNSKKSSLFFMQELYA